MYMSSVHVYMPAMQLYKFCSKFLYGDDRKTICPNGEIPGSPLKSLKKLVSGGSGVKARHGRVTGNIQFFMPKYICRACRGISSVFSVSASCVIV